MAKTYIENYQVLKEASKQLAEMQEPDVDKILPLVTEGLKAYDLCRSRIEAVRQQLATTEIKPA